MGKLALLLCIFSVVLTMPALAGDIMQFSEDPHTATILPLQAIGLHNSAEQTITVFLAGHDGTEKSVDISRNDWCIVSDETSSRYTIRIPTTGGRQVRYQLWVGNRYEIFWNADADVWDVALIHKR